MSNPTLSGKRVAILVADGFEQVELTDPKRALDQAGAKTSIVSPAQGQVKGWNHTEWGDQFPVDERPARPDVARRGPPHRRHDVHRRLVEENAARHERRDVGHALNRRLVERVNRAACP